MPVAEAIELAGSFEALRPYLRDGRILARHGGIYSWPDGSPKDGPGDIDPDGWEDARFDADSERVIFRVVLGDFGDRGSVYLEEFAEDVELKRRAVERLIGIEIGRAPL